MGELGTEGVVAFLVSPHGLGLQRFRSLGLGI